MTDRTQTECELAAIIVEVLNLPDITPDKLVPDEPLFGPGSTLALDSIDALEIAVAVAQRYGVQLRAEDEVTKRVFASIRSLALHIDATRPAAATG